MAAFLSTVCTFLIILMAASQSSSAEVATSRLFMVGDDFGWRQPLPNDTAFYIQWAESNRFHVGDSLGNCVVQPFHMHLTLGPFISSCFGLS